MIQFLYAFYDGECGLCASARRWLSGQTQLVPVYFVAYQSEEARLLCPSLPELHPGRNIVVLADTGEVYQGDAAWITLLWATASWRSVSVDLSSPGLRSLVRPVVEAISENRLTISKWLGLRARGAGACSQAPA